MAIPDIPAMTLSVSPTDLAQPTDTPDALPPHRSHDPALNLKRSDPFQFGSRYLLPDDDPFEFNAWDHIEPSAEDVRHFETRVAQQRAAPVLDFDRQRFNSDPARWWNRFYANNTSNFFKDRKWLKQEFPVLKEVTQKGAGTKVLLEIGAGAGNTCFPVLKDNANDELMVYACDFSPKAVDLIRESTAYDLHHVRAEVWDVASPSLPHGLDEGTVDVVLLIFIFSALHPTQWKQAVRNIWRLLKPGGEVCFRDYGRGDLAQVRMKKGRYMEENFYIRGDGTRVYFFDKDELRNIWSGEIFQKETFDDPESKDDGPSGVGVAAQATDIEGDVVHEQSEAVDGYETLEFIRPIETWFEIEDLDVDRRLLINRQRQLRMYRCWMQGRFRKPNRSEATPGH